MDKYLTLKQAFLSNNQDENKITTIDKGENIREISYKTLKVYSKKIANYFSKKGIGKGTKVILSISDMQTFIYTFWGAVLAGAVVIPVVPPPNGYIKGKQDASRLISIYHEVLPKYLITCTEEYSNLQEVMGEESDSILSISEDLIVNENEIIECSEVTEEDLAIILFTSGSTGMPKGVPLSNKKVLESCYQNIEYFKYTSENSFLNWLPLQHIASIILYHVMPTILKANQVQVCTNEILSDAKKWLYYMDKYKVQSSFGPNFIYDMLLEQKNEIENMDISLSHVMYVINGGEAINFNITDKCVRMLEKKGFQYNAMIPGWGMTELGNGGIYSKNFGEVLYGKCISIGKPMDGLSVRIVKDGNIITDEEIEGTLEVKGDFIFNGYLNNNEENSKRFTKDGWFNTGDIVIWKSHELVITGRESEIFILNGVNISINEIEEYIKSKLSDKGISSLLKFINVKNTENNRDELYVFLEEQENSNEIISIIKKSVVDCYGFSINKVVLVPKNSFPRTSIGKIDSKLLVQNMKNNKYEFYSNKPKTNANESNYSDEENLLLFIWADVLKIEKSSISLDDDFFSLGGNSIKVPVTLNRINEALNISINAAEFVRYSTIAEFLKYIHSNDEAAIDSDDDEIIML